jgi:sulfate adenylyltransferase subunit 2
MRIDTGYKFPEMIEFRDWFTKEIGSRLVVELNEEWIGNGVHPLKKHKLDAAFGGARREVF